MKQRSHVIQLKPNNQQVTHFEKACGCQRFVYNWGLSAWKMEYDAGNKPTGRGLKKQFNAIKHTEYPWIAEVTKCICDSAFENLNRAFQNFFRTKNGKIYPKFHKKGVKDSFTVDNTKFVVDGKKIRIPKLGWVRMTEELRFDGKLMSATVKKRAGKWFVSIAVETVDVSGSQVSGAVGIDLGVMTLATLSDGIVFENPKTYYKYDKQLRRAQKSLSRKKRGSKNRAKAKLKLSGLHYRISCVVDDYIHKMTRHLANNYHTVVLEDLNVKGMLRNRRLSKAISRSNFHKIRQFLQSKCGDVRLIDRFYPSSKTCSSCGRVKEMPLHLRTYDCECGLSLCRDLNAARNILAQGLGNVKPVEMKALATGSGSETIVREAGNVLKTTMGPEGPFVTFCKLHKPGIMATKREKLYNIFIKFFKCGRLLYFGDRWYDTRYLKDPTSYRHKRAKYGRDTLINDLLDTHNIDEIKEAIKITKGSKTPQAFLDCLRKKTRKPQNDFFVFFDLHYGVEVHNVFKYLLLLQHRKVRALSTIGEEPKMMWKNERISLINPVTQEVIYNDLFNACPDPLALKLALAPQRWEWYTKLDLEEMFKKIKYYYQRILDPSRSSVDLLKLEADSDLNKYAKLAIRFTQRLTERNVFIHPHKTFQGHASSIYLDALYNPSVIYNLKKFDFSMYVKSLQYGVLADPWEFLNDVLQGTYQSNMGWIIKRYSFMEDLPEIVNRFALKKILTKGKEDEGNQGSS